MSIVSCINVHNQCFYACSISYIYSLVKLTNSRIIPCTLIELLQGYLSISVSIHLTKDLLRSLLLGGLIIRHLHLVYGCYNIQHLPLDDEPVPVHIIHVEHPLQLLICLTSGGDANCTEKFSEVNEIITVGVKSPEDMLRKTRGVAIRKQLSVHRHDLIHCDQA